MEQLLIATSDGLIISRREGGGWREIARGLDGHDVTAVIAREGVILAGTSDGIFRSDDGGRQWREASGGLGIRHVRWLAFHPAVSDLEFAGTEPAGIFVSRDGGENWRERPEVAKLRHVGQWYLPYSPEAGCVRGFAVHGSRLYAAVEVGGVLVSDDNGETWRLAEGSSGRGSLSAPPRWQIASDVHSIEVHPSSPDLVFAPTNDGLYRSADGGKTWERLYAGYCRVAWIDPRNANHIIFGPADSVDMNGRIEQSRDGGRTWRSASNGLKTPWRDHMVERLTPLGDELLAVLSNGHLYSAPLDTLQWIRILPHVAHAAALAVD